MYSFSTVLRLIFILGLCALGWLSPKVHPEKPAAEACLFFPNARSVDWRERDQGAGAAFSEPRDWARTVLSSAGLAEAVRQELGPGSPQAVLASCSLLTEESRLQLISEEPGLLRIVVQADDQEIALQLCEGLVEHLKTSLAKHREEAIKLGLAHLTEQQAAVLERQENAEKDLVKQIREHQRRPQEDEQSSLWGLGHRKDAVEFGTRGDYVSGLAASRRLKAEELKLALQEETALPGFSIVDPPHAAPHGIALWEHGLGLLAGASLSALLMWAQLRRRKA